MIAAPHQNNLTTRQRWISLVEFIAAGAIVIAHNVYRRIPNEVPILFVLGRISIRLRDRGWKMVGLHKPDSWRKTILWGVLSGVLIISAGQLADFAGERIWHQPAKARSVIHEAKSTWKAALRGFGIVWTFAAFEEEMVYRGHLMTRAAEVGKRTKPAYMVSLFASSILFGFGHYFKGPPGILDSTVSGLIPGGAYLRSRRNLWIPIVAHGCADTIAIAATFLGAD